MTRGFTQITDPRFNNQEQSWNAQGEYKHNVTGKVVRVSIRRNAFDGQSYKRVAVFDLQSGQWHTMTQETLVKTDKCYPISYTKTSLGKPDRDLFVADMIAALVVPGQILSAAASA